MKNAIKNIFKTKAYLSLSLFIVSLLIFFTLVLQVNVVPTLKNIAYENILNEAKKVSNYMSDLIDYNNQDLNEIDKKLKKIITDFNIDKIHYFNKEGKVIYSTLRRKIGYINKYNYFQEIIAKGNPYYSIKLKNTISSEREPITKDVIEIYIPIMNDKNEFLGAFELYYDISKHVEKLDNYSNLILKVNIFLVFIILILFSYLIYMISLKSLNEKKLTSKDYLTNLYNRRYFYEVVKSYINLSKREKQALCICMIDIDNFKQINDTYGHTKGDEILKTFAQETKSFVRKSDLVIRFGGEEFLILLPHTNLEQAQVLCNKICKHFESLKNEINFTVSIGLAEHNNNQKIDDTINQADKCLYEAKHKGKNRVITKQ